MLSRVAGCILGNERQGVHSLPSECMYVCVFVHTITQARMKLEYSHLARVFTRMTSGAGMFFRSKGQRSRSRSQGQ